MYNVVKNAAVLLVGGCAVYVAIATAARRDVSLSEAVREPVPEAQAGPISGTRLKGKYKLGDDGSKVYDPNVFHDAQRNEDCTYAIAGDAVMRCLPTSVWTDPIFFVDAACTQPVVYMSVGQAGCQFTPPAYASQTQVPLCGSPDTVHVFPIGALVAATGQLYSGGPSNCARQGPTIQQGFATYAVGAEVPASSFVDGTPGVDP